MMIAVIVATTSRATTRASSATSDSKESANKSSDYRSTGNYHLVISSKKEDGRCASQSPGNNKALLSPNSDTKKRNVSDAFVFASFLELDVWQHLSGWRQRGLLRHEFWRGTGRTQSVHPPVEICTANRTCFRKSYCSLY
jgi:hypothetical protein